tara:strand:- start:1459 stop:1911 length:453 start_codon:yes stop_codon:yes gene_type:complete
VADYENPWIYGEHPFTGDDIGDIYGFVYRITNRSTQKQYIGRKNFWSKRKPRSNNSTGKRRRVTTESNWKSYYGSSPELKEDILKYGKENFSREILSFHYTQGKLNFEETRQLFLNNVLTESMEDGTPAFYNSNILGRYYRKDYFQYDKE